MELCTLLKTFTIKLKKLLLNPIIFGPFLQKRRDFRQTRIEGRTPLNNRAIEIHVKIQESKAHFEAFLARNLIIFMNKSLNHR